MRKRFLRAGLAAALLQLAACTGIDHNIPTDPISSNPPPGGITLYADANGHLYPDDWDPPFKRSLVEKRHSLLASANFDRAVHASLRAERDRQLDAAAARLQAASRIFVLVHGFNNSHGEARQAFDAVRRNLRLAAGDEIVEFHWDGLSGRNYAARGAMWFNAVGYSQVAGTQALRGLLRRLPDKDFVVIAHSRGTSVVLSALSDPSYDPDFRRATEKLLNHDGMVDFGSAPLGEGRGRIDLLFHAPAIGKPDFWRPYNRGAGCEAYRPFPRRLRSMHYAVNPKDPVLKKILRPLASRFNATDLGLDPRVGRSLQTCYRDLKMVPYPLTMPSHPFVDYVENPVFDRMLAAVGAAGLQVPSADLPPPPRP